MVVVSLMLSEGNFDAVAYHTLGLLNLFDCHPLRLVNLLHHFFRIHVNVLFHSLLALLQELLHYSELENL